MADAAYINTPMTTHARSKFIDLIARSLLLYFEYLLIKRNNVIKNTLSFFYSDVVHFDSLNLVSDAYFMTNVFISLKIVKTKYAHIKSI